MTETATVTSKSMINIPAKIRKKYGIKAGHEVAFLEREGEIVLVPIPPLGELFGNMQSHKKELLEGVRELEAEHRREARE
ncbi:MAG: AbrB/MazE/SpoVT family DNA-binding domain-containing protein [Nitrososphaerales archaeon]|nr:AbrB/MazE/SpoVT family DNA-binding domain-containing protein [Nitrososphaerales archaeon]